MTSRFVAMSLAGAVLAALPARAQTPVLNSGARVASRTAPVTEAVRVPTAPNIDGHIDDAAWLQARAITTFTQRDPNEGEPASEATEVRIVYDDEAIYVAARMEDRGKVTSRLGRRDMSLTSSDWFRVSFDTYRDRRVGVRFDVNPAGVRRDATVSTGTGDGDLAWDAVWATATSVDARGWSAELRIPFSQLRFAASDDQVWGLQLERIISAKQETVLYSFTPKSEPSGPPAFGDLSGLRTIRPGRPLEVIPYAVSNVDFAESGDNPFRGDRELTGNAGLDARYRITSNMTLSATINPDFGQVEVDPAVINLTAYETRFDERRPFFVEGSSNFRFAAGIQGPAANAAALLYSRRIGRAPQLGIKADDVDIPGVTSILGALKVSGKTANGWSVGVLNAMTGQEKGDFIDPAGIRQQAIVEPRANYFAGRVNKEFRRGMSTIGAMLTDMHRDLSEPVGIASLRSRANAGGIDFNHEWANRGWAIGGYAVGSQIAGSADSILSTQRSSSRYYQRPDSTRLELNPTATSMSGYGSAVQLRKQSGVHWTGDIWVATISPGFEINDTGFLQRTDRHSTGGALRYTERRPGKVLRTWNFNVVQNHSMNYDGNWWEKAIRPSASFTFLNYWSLGFGGGYDREREDDRLTRGGPIVRRPGAWSARASIESDPRRAVMGDFEYSAGGDRAGGYSRSISSGIELHTSPRWNLTVGPRYSRSRTDAQYVSTVTDSTMTATFGARYIFAPIVQKELSLVTRLNYTFTPDLTLEMYLQPLLSHGDYGTPKEFQRPSTYDFAVYGTDIGSITKSGTQYTVDPDAAGPAVSFKVSDRSFTTRSLRGNVVVRWEYRPGSTLYFVWQQERVNQAFTPDFRIGSGLGDLFDGDGRNAIAVKWSYWINP